MSKKRLSRRRLKFRFFINTKEIYDVIADLPISLNLLLIFQNRQVATVVYPKTSTKVIPLSTFLDFCNFQFVRVYLRNYDTDLCKIDTTILVSVVFHDAIFTTRTSWSLLHLNNIVTSVTYFANDLNHGYSNGALGPLWGPQSGSLGPTSRGLN